MSLTASRCLPVRGSCPSLLDYIEGCDSLDDFLEQFPSVERAQAVAVLAMARERPAVDALLA